MNIVTGHTGFIGSNLFSKLKDPYGVKIQDCFEFIHNFDGWKEVECVYHLGAISDTTCTDVEKIYKYNVSFTLQLFQKCIQHKVPIKYASSASVYGNLQPNINPLNHYSLSKATIDYWVLENMHLFSDIQGYRFFNVYGKGEGHKGNQASPVHQFTQQCLRGQPIKVFKNSENFIRDFVCVDDVVSVMQIKMPKGIYDLGSSNPISFLRVAELVAEKYSGTIQEIEFPNHLVGRYQTYTRAKQVFDHDFISVENWLSTIHQSSV